MSTSHQFNLFVSPIFFRSYLILSLKPFNIQGQRKVTLSSVLPLTSRLIIPCESSSSDLTSPRPDIYSLSINQTVCLQVRLSGFARLAFSSQTGGARTRAGNQALFTGSNRNISMTYYQLLSEPRPSPSEIQSTGLNRDHPESVTSPLTQARHS